MKKSISIFLFVLTLIQVSTQGVGAQTVEEIDQDIKTKESEVQQIDQELSASQQEYADLVEQSKELSQKIEETGKKIEGTESEIENITNEIPEIENRAKTTLSMLQKNNHINYVIQILNNNDESGADKIRATVAANKLTSSSYDSVVLLAEKVDSLGQEKENLNQLTTQLADEQESADKKTNELIALIEQKESEKISQESELETQAAQKKFLEDAGCKEGDVYGVDCGIKIPEVQPVVQQESKSDKSNAQEEAQAKAEEEQTKAQKEREEAEAKAKAAEEAAKKQKDKAAQAKAEEEAKKAQAEAEAAKAAEEAARQKAEEEAVRQKAEEEAAAKEEAAAEEDVINNNTDNDSNDDASVPNAVGFRRPMRDGVVTNEYGGYDGYGGGHRGIDISNSPGTPIYATAPGVVIDAGSDGNRGNYVSIIHNVNGVNSVSAYWHMSSITVGVGQSVTSDTQVGAVGSTGIATGPHLHFGLDMNATTYSNARAINPRGYVSFPAKGTWFHSR